MESKPCLTTCSHRILRCLYTLCKGYCSGFPSLQEWEENWCRTGRFQPVVLHRLYWSWFQRLHVSEYSVGRNPLYNTQIGSVFLQKRVDQGHNLWVNGIISWTDTWWKKYSVEICTNRSGSRPTFENRQIKISTVLILRGCALSGAAAFIIFGGMGGPGPHNNSGRNPYS